MKKFEIILEYTLAILFWLSGMFFLSLFIFDSKDQEMKIPLIIMTSVCLAWGLFLFINTLIRRKQTK